MNQERNPFRVIEGYLVPNSAEPPASAEEVFANALAEHLKVHAADGMSLFVFATRSPSGVSGIFTLSAQQTPRLRSLSLKLSTSPEGCHPVTSGASAFPMGMRTRVTLWSSNRSGQKRARRRFAPSLRSGGLGPSV